MVRAIIRKASTRKYSTSQLKDLYEAHVSIKKFQRLLNDIYLLIYMRSKLAPRLSKLHKENSIKRCKYMLLLSRSMWENAFFPTRRSSISMYQMVCTTGLTKSWNLGIFASVHMGDSLMVWDCFSCCGVGPIVKVSETLNDKRYAKQLEKHLVPHAE